jgi:hypothetical protein
MSRIFMMIMNKYAFSPNTWLKENYATFIMKKTTIRHTKMICVFLHNFQSQIPPLYASFFFFYSSSSSSNGTNKLLK